MNMRTWRKITITVIGGIIVYLAAGKRTQTQREVILLPAYEEADAKSILMEEIERARESIEVIKEEEVHMAAVEEEQEEAPASRRAYYDVPISHELQDYIIEVCDQYNIAPALVIAMIERESDYSTSCVGDDGCSMGLMQVQEKWHRERMDRLGCTNLMNPEQCILVAVDFLAELFADNEDVMWVLMAYNGGMAYANRHIDDPTDYAIYITERAYELERSYEDGH